MRGYRAIIGVPGIGFGNNLRQMLSKIGRNSIETVKDLELIVDAQVLNNHCE